MRMNYPARAFLRCTKLYHEKQFMGLPSYWLEDITPPHPERRSVEKFVQVKNQIYT